MQSTYKANTKKIYLYNKQTETFTNGYQQPTHTNNVKSGIFLIRIFKTTFSHVSYQANTQAQAKPHNYVSTILHKPFSTVYVQYGTINNATKLHTASVT